MALKPDYDHRTMTDLTHDVKRSKKRSAQMGSDLSVSDLAGRLEKGMSRFCFTAGQYSFSDVIQYVLSETGPADLYLSTWAASSDGIKRAFEFLQNGKIRTIKFMIDTGAKQYRDAQFGALIDRFGDCLRTTRIHAKFCVIRNERWDVVIRTSANLNKNLRLESFEIDENQEFADFFQRFFDEAFSKIPVNECHRIASSQKLKPVLNAAGNRTVLMDDDVPLRFDIDGIHVCDA
jgi:hypothetical protein